MALLHYLNVRDGDCTLIEHNSGHKTVMDVCNASSTVGFAEDSIMKAARLKGNFDQKSFPVNPISYLKNRGISSIFRFILSHPDMDHMDGIEDFFATFSPVNFWDTANQCNKDFTNGGGKYSEDDWKFYLSLRDGNPQDDPKRLVLHSGARAAYFNQDPEGKGGGDGLHILAPTPELVKNANDCDDYNDCSYVILYRTSHNHRIVLAGDSHDSTWEHILKAHGEDLKDIDLLIAPHHGRDSNRSYEFLEVLKPAMTFFGNARSEHLAYWAWNNRSLPFMTNNQANCIIVDTSDNPMSLYVTNEGYAKKVNGSTSYNDQVGGYYCQRIQR